MKDIVEYLSMRERMIESAIASERLAGSDFKLACERSALAEIIGIQNFLLDAAQEQKEAHGQPTTEQSAPLPSFCIGCHAVIDVVYCENCRRSLSS